MNKIPLMTLLWLVVFYCPVKAGAGAAPRIDTVQMERQIHQRINHERRKQGLAPLVLDEKLTLIARQHSQDMAKHDFFSHINLQGEDPTARARRQGWDKKKQIGSHQWKTGLSENIFLNSLYSRVVTTTRNGVVDKEYIWKSQEQIVQSTVQGWMDSPSHRKNILSPRIDRQGIGVAISGNDVYVTENMF